MITFWESETYAIIKAMKRNGNRPGLIAEWKDAIERWAMLPENMRCPDAAAVRAWLPVWQPRVGYTVEELAPMWPALAIAVGHATHWPAVLKSPKRLEFELDYAGLPFHLVRLQKFYIVERVHHWSKISPVEFEQELFGA